MFATILHANDGSDGAFKALLRALELAKLTGARLHMVSVEELPQFPEIIEEIKAEKAIADRRYREVIHRARAAAEERGVRLEHQLRTGHPVQTIVDLAAELKADLLVIGATGHSTFFERVIGTRADRIVDLAPCAVLVVR
jgi:nucleotide-binding universal stress UspA family protein